MKHEERQRVQHDLRYAEGPRKHTVSDDPLTNYITRWRLKEAFRRLNAVACSRLKSSSKILVMCAGEGFEGTVLCDLGYSDVTVSDISEIGVQQAIHRDPRLKGMTLNAEQTEVADGTFDVVVVQDGLHHLRNPVKGFTEMLRLSKVATVFLEPHDSLVGLLIGTKWEKNGEAINYVFRWTKRLVGDVASSYLVEQPFENLSFSFWHHNVVYEKLSRFLGGGRVGLLAIQAIKTVFDVVLGRAGNQFCGMVLKK